jgi:hypothetical protein
MAMFCMGTVKHKCALTSKKLGTELWNIYKILGLPKTKTYRFNFFFARDAYGHSNDFNILDFQLSPCSVQDIRKRLYLVVFTYSTAQNAFCCLVGAILKILCPRERRVFHSKLGVSSSNQCNLHHSPHTLGT